MKNLYRMIANFDCGNRRPWPGIVTPALAADKVTFLTRWFAKA